MSLVSSNVSPCRLDVLLAPGARVVVLDGDPDYVGRMATVLRVDGRSVSLSVDLKPGTYTIARTSVMPVQGYAATPPRSGSAQRSDDDELCDLVECFYAQAEDGSAVMPLLRRAYELGRRSSAAQTLDVTVKSEGTVTGTAWHDESGGGGPSFVRQDVLGAAARICREVAEEYNMQGSRRRGSIAEECAERIGDFANTFVPGHCAGVSDDGAASAVPARPGEGQVGSTGAHGTGHEEASRASTPRSSAPKARPADGPAKFCGDVWGPDGRTCNLYAGHAGSHHNAGREWVTRKAPEAIDHHSSGLPEGQTGSKPTTKVVTASDGTSSTSVHKAGAASGLTLVDRGMWDRIDTMFDEAGFPARKAQCVQTPEDRLRDLLSSRAAPSSSLAFDDEKANRDLGFLQELFLLRTVARAARDVIAARIPAVSAELEGSSWKHSRVSDGLTDILQAALRAADQFTSPAREPK